MALRFMTAGESHGPGLTAILEGMPAGLAVDAAAVDEQLRRRQGGFGRGGRMKIEKDQAQFTAGIRQGRTLGSPIALQIANRDHKNWQAIMGPFAPPTEPAKRVVHAPRPGHADLAGGAKHRFADLRNVLERASARETAARVAVGSIARQFLEAFGVRIYSHTRSLGPVQVELRIPADVPLESIEERTTANDLGLLDPGLYDVAVAEITAARKAGDTVGGVVEVIVSGLPPGLGSHVHWDRKLDGKLAQAVCSIPAIKGMEFGEAFEDTRRRGSQVHDPLHVASERGWSRSQNHAAGLEGGITNGEPVIVRGAMKPLSTLMKPLQTIDIATGEAAQAAVERSDVCAVPACGVVVEAMVAFVLADAWLEKFGADCMADIEYNVQHYLEEVRRWVQSS